jgi:hypothetical protein
MTNRAILRGAEQGGGRAGFDSNDRRHLGHRESFSNDRSKQVSQEGVLLETVDAMAADVAGKLFASAGGKSAAALADCTPQAAGDADCLKAFAQHMGRLFLRIPMSAWIRKPLIRYRFQLRAKLIVELVPVA